MARWKASQDCKRCWFVSLVLFCAAISPAVASRAGCLTLTVSSELTTADYMNYVLNQPSNVPWTLYCTIQEDDCDYWADFFWTNFDGDCNVSETVSDDSQASLGCLVQDFSDNNVTSLEFRIGYAGGPYYHYCAAREQGTSGMCDPVSGSDDVALSATCFPGWARVQLQNGTEITLAELRLGDSILCINATGLGCCPVNSFLNAHPVGDPRGPSSFNRFWYNGTDGLACLSSTQNHLLFVAN